MILQKIHGHSEEGQVGGGLSLSWKAFFESYKLLFLQYHYNINEQYLSA
jgi:hypothetical protein